MALYAIIRPDNVLMMLSPDIFPVAGYQSILVDDECRMEAGKWQYINGEFIPYDGPNPQVIEKPAEA
ncbi:hypothetical protein FEE59_13900 [Herbaspirillum sp. RU 5E]|nr:hypothetical protein [Herbaspirillum sp. RU 5E]